MANQYFYSDLNLRFQTHPGTGDVLKKYDVDAVKNSMRHILTTNIGEKLFDPEYGCNVTSILFENFNPLNKHVLIKKIQEKVSRYEPRAKLENVFIQDDIDNNSTYIEIAFHVIGFPAIYTITIDMDRLR